MQIQVSKKSVIISMIAVLSAVIFSLFWRWHPGGETWLYWLFARILSETGTFTVMDRSPLYVLYLNLFYGLGYPNAVFVEYVVSTLFLVFSLILFFHRFLGIYLSTLYVLLWLPFFQTAPPPTLKLALAFTCIGFCIRIFNKSRKNIVVFYTLLCLACLFRITFVVIVVVFLIWDLYKGIKQLGPLKAARSLCPKKADGLLLIPVILYFMFISIQSPHHWNNPAGEDIPWWPRSRDNLVDMTFIHNYNWQYIERNSKQSDTQDYYYTNKNLFKGAGTMVEAIKANPRFVVKQLALNTKEMVALMGRFTLIPWFFYGHFLRGSLFWIFFNIFILIPLILLVLWGAFKATKEQEDLLPFFVGNLLIVLTSLIALPKERYLYNLIPIYGLSAYWLGKTFFGVFKEKSIQFKKNLEGIGVLIFLIIFSNGIIRWNTHLQNFYTDFKKNQVEIMGGERYSLIKIFHLFQPVLVDECDGIMSAESAFWAAFTPKPIESFYAVTEIPPFGNYKQSTYKGLRPERINCLIITEELKQSAHSGFNFKLRYTNYIEPYIREKGKIGKELYDVDGKHQLLVIKN